MRRLIVNCNEQNAMKYDFWTFNHHTPGPFIRVRVGDTMELTLTNNDQSGMPHNIDVHAVSGLGGGAAVTLARFKLLCQFTTHAFIEPIPLITCFDALSPPCQIPVCTSIIVRPLRSPSTSR